MQIHLEKRIHTNQPMYRRTYTRVYVSYYLWRTEPRSLIGNQGRARVRHSAAESPTWVRMRKPVFEPATIRRNNGQPSLPLFPSIPGSSFSPSFPSSHTNTRSDITRDDKYTRIYRPSLRALHDFEQVNLSTILTFGLFMGDEATWNAIERIETWRVAICIKIYSIFESGIGSKNSFRIYNTIPSLPGSHFNETYNCTSGRSRSFRRSPLFSRQTVRKLVIRSVSTSVEPLRGTGGHRL